MSTVRDLESEFSEFKNLFKDLQVKFNLLSEKHEALEKKYDEVISKKYKDYRCVRCDKVFSDERKLKIHCKTHVETYSCEVCARNFKCADIMSKHQQIAHENLKLYCHYFNNLKNCPFQEECIFLHEVSKKCKFENGCDRQLCMFRHEDVEEVLEENVKNLDQSELLNVDEEDATIDDTEFSNKTFNNPSQVDKGDGLFRCEFCDFASAMKDIIVNHKELLHNFCTECDETFTSQKKLKTHLKNHHKDKC